MDWLLLAKAAIMGIVEGLTEFFPISSTGHLIVVGDLINFDDRIGNVFEVVIQLGAILAVCWEYRARLWQVAIDLPTSTMARKFVLNLLIAFLPAAIVGVLLIKTIKSYLFNPVAVACALVVGGLVILWAERRECTARVHRIDDMSHLDALKVGLAQIASLIPGTSRSGSTIIGGMLFGLDRRVATEFSFFLAIPIMFAATAYDVLKHWELFTAADLPTFGTGFLFAFLSAFIAVRGLIRFVASHTFNVFAWYRIVFGLIILGSWWLGLINWAS
ncbi:undecaprenyl-diphosphate phosphatase [Laribacter hongkongensis]|uniref:undecaprenyl-diphosphate phosphatase n=1 Tax=Laribacter hongkongensis TaxID=168471 RepID=UPI001EFE2859|nr:undecaprenyl-diphosphate phosphatase [Laribacter hongkongensis]MCG9118619.1 undecaprenyl-diphosphate phosphatase [Laribacter hongkongensis]